MELDHVVIVVGDLQRAIDNYQTLGFRVTPGGQHSDGRTHNALVSFADTRYLELIAFMPGVDALDHRWRQANQQGGGIADWALRVEHLPERVAQLGQAGVGYSEVQDGGRLRPDGVRIAWRIASPLERNGLPFLIEDTTPRHLRIPAGGATEHPNGVKGISAVVVALRDQADSAIFAKLLGIEAGEPTPDPLLATDVVELAHGATRLVLASAPAGPINEHVGRLGAGPYALLLQTDKERIGWLDEQLTGGAPLRLQPM